MTAPLRATVRCTSLQRGRGFAFAFALIGIAPYQCGGRSADPELRREDTADDALWSFAEERRAKGDDESARAALVYLVEHYPSGRHAEEARRRLEATKGAEAGRDVHDAHDGRAP